MQNAQVIQLGDILGPRNSIMVGAQKVHIFGIC